MSTLVDEPSEIQKAKAKQDVRALKKAINEASSRAPSITYYAPEHPCPCPINRRVLAPAAQNVAKKEELKKEISEEEQPSKAKLVGEPLLPF